VTERTVFYSWQSDIKNGINRSFIEDAINKALSQFNAQFKVEAAVRPEDNPSELKFQKDSTGAPGSSPIVDTILERISNCAVYMPDLTFIAKSPEGRLCPNPNVLVEYGWALSTIGNKRILPIINTAYGALATEALPFDMRHLKWPLTYELSESTPKEERPAIKAKLVKEILSRLKDIADDGLLKDILDSDRGFVEAEPLPSDVGSYIGPTDAFEWTNDVQTPVEVKGYLHPFEKIFLRLIPGKKTTKLPSPKRGMELLRAADMLPMSHSETHKLFGRNRLGGFVMSNPQPGTFLNNVTQLFLSKELWGVDAELINKKLQQSRSNSQRSFLPSVQIEAELLRTLKRYLEFMKGTLAIEPPLTVVVGLTGVKGYGMLIPQKFYAAGSLPIHGRIDEDHIVWRETIANYNIGVEDFLGSFFNTVWEYAGLDRPDMRPFHRDI
jgi:hypothetical protein